MGQLLVLLGSQISRVVLKRPGKGSVTQTMGGYFCAPQSTKQPRSPELVWAAAWSSVSDPMFLYDLKEQRMLGTSDSFQELFATPRAATMQWTLRTIVDPSGFEAAKQAVRHQHRSYWIPLRSGLTVETRVALLNDRTALFQFRVAPPTSAFVPVLANPGR